MKLIGRKKYLNKLKSLATFDPDNRAFFGVKGLGKSMLIENVFSKSNCKQFAEEYHFLYVRTILAPAKKGDDLVEFLLDKVTSAIDLIDDDSVKEELLEKREYGFTKFLKKESVLRELLQIIKDYEYYVILVMDEFHNLGRNTDVGSDQYDFLRSLNEEGLMYYWIVSDSDFSDVYATEQFTTSFFAQKFNGKTMPQMEREDMKELLGVISMKYDVELNGNEDDILDIISGIPGFAEAAVECYEQLSKFDYNRDRLIDAMLENRKCQSFMISWSRSLTNDQKELLISLVQREKIYQKEYEEEGTIGKINQLGDQSGLGLIVQGIDDNGVYWTINCSLFGEFICRKEEVFLSVSIKEMDEERDPVVIQQPTYIQNNYYNITNNIFSADDALSALVELKRMVTVNTPNELPDNSLVASAVKQLPFQQDGWDTMDDMQKDEQIEEYAERVFASDEFKSDALSESQMKRFFLTDRILEELSESSRRNLISAIQVYDLLQFCVDRFGLNLLNSESARGILFVKVYESILKESLRQALKTVTETADVQLKLDNTGNLYTLDDAPLEKLTIGSFTYILKKRYRQQALANVCVTQIGRDGADENWWYQHVSNIFEIEHLRNDCCHSGNAFSADKLRKLVKYLFEDNMIANVEVYNDIANRIM